MNEETIVPIIGADRTVASVVELSAEIYEPGLVQRDTTRAGTWFGVGELDGTITERVGEIARLLRHSAKVSVTREHPGCQMDQAGGQLDDHGSLLRCSASRTGMPPPFRG